MYLQTVKLAQWGLCFPAPPPLLALQQPAPLPPEAGPAAARTCSSFALLTRLSQHRQLVAPAPLTASIGAFRPLATGLQSLSRSSTSARMARTCTLNSLNRSRSSFSAKASDTW